MLHCQISQAYLPVLQKIPRHGTRPLTTHPMYKSLKHLKIVAMVKSALG